MLSPKRGLLDELLGDIDRSAVALKRARCTTPVTSHAAAMEDPYRAVANFERGELEYRDDDLSVQPVSIMDAAVTYNIPEPTPAYFTLKKMAEAHERVLPFETYWLHISRFTTLDLSLPVHMLAVYMVEAYRKKVGLARVIRPFQELAARFNATKGTGNVRGKQVKAQFLSMRKIIYPADCEGGAPSDGHVEFYVREILVTEKFYFDILHNQMDRKKAHAVTNECIRVAKRLIRSRPAIASTCDHTVVRHAIWKVAKDWNLGDFNYKPPKPGKKEEWLE